jgi:NTE family protein
MEKWITFVLLTWSPFLVAQPFKNLVFEGGGMRGVSYAGALYELEQAGHLKSIEKVGGTSVGAITALTLSLGYTPKEIEELIGRTNPRKFNDGTFLLVGGGTRLRKHYGWFKGDAFLRWTEKVIKNKTDNADITFQQLHGGGYIDLYVTGTSLNHQKVIVFSHESYPNMKVKDAIRISMSTPFFFKAIFIDSVGNVLKNRKSKMDYDIMVDGGFISNYPIDLFDTKDSTGLRIANSNTLGFRMDTEAQLRYDELGLGLAPIKIKSLKNYIGAFYNFIMENMKRAWLTEEDWNRTVSSHDEL